MCSLRSPTPSAYGKSASVFASLTNAFGLWQIRKWANGHRGKGARGLRGKGAKWLSGNCHLATLPSCHFAIYICIFAYLLICISLAQAKTQLITTHISLGKNVEDYILIAETGGITATVTIDFYNQKGDLVESIRKILPSHTTIKIQVSKFLHETGIIMVNSDSDGIAGQHYYAAQSDRKRKDRVLISAPLQIRKSEGEIRKAESVSREIGTGQFCIPYADFISDPDDVGAGADVPSSGGAGVGSYIVVSDASEDLRTSGSIFEMRFYNREGEAISKVKSEIGKRETKIFKLNEYINSHGGITLDDYQEQEAKSGDVPPFPKGGQGGFTGVNHVAKFGKVNLNIAAGDVICEYVQFHPSNGVLIIPGIIYDSENKLPTPAPPKEGTEVPIFLYRFPLFSLQMPKEMSLRAEQSNQKYKSDSPFNKGGRGDFPFFEKLFITDILGYGPAVNVEVLSNSSELLAQTKKLLPPHGTGMLELEDYTTNFEFGAIKIHSQSQIAAVYYFSPATQQFPTSTSYSYAASSAGASEGERRKAKVGSKKLPTSDSISPFSKGGRGDFNRLPTSFVIPWLSPRDDMEIHLFMTNTENEVNEIQINFYHKDGSSFVEQNSSEEFQGVKGKSVPKVLLRDVSVLLKPGIIHEWQPFAKFTLERSEGLKGRPGILFPKDEQGSILLNSSSSNLAVLLLGVNANTGQIVMSVQAQACPRTK